jgi:hypothetical protein
VSLSDELFVALGRELDEDQLVELTSVIAVESMRGRFNLALAAAPRVSARHGVRGAGARRESIPGRRRHGGAR